MKYLDLLENPIDNIPISVLETKNPYKIFEYLKNNNEKNYIDALEEIKRVKENNLKTLNLAG